LECSIWIWFLSKSYCDWCWFIGDEIF
jgi:hypothetical protein